VGAKHRKREMLGQRRSSTDHAGRHRISAVTAVCDVLFSSLLCAACLIALMLDGVQPEKRTVAATQEPSPASQPVSQEGIVIAATAGSVTARSANGCTQTYLVTSNTTVITHDGSHPATAATHFTVNDRVIVVGTVQGGTALATTVADRDAGHGSGPPMDDLESQAIPPGDLGGGAAPMS
jgi:hypothetical protein